MKISDWISRLTGMTLGETIENRAVRDVSGSLLIQVTGKLLQIGLAILLARVLPLKQFGLFSLVFSWAMVLTTPAILGTPPFVQREIAISKSRQQWGRVKDLLRWSTLTVSVASVFVLSMAFLGGRIGYPSGSADRLAFLIGFLMIPLMAFLRLWQGQLRGWGAVLAGQAPSMLIQRLLFAVFLLATVCLFVSFRIDAVFALTLQLVSILLTLIFTGFLKLRYIRLPIAEAEKPPVWDWLRASSRFALVGGLVILSNRIGILMVGAMLGKADTGLFSVAVKGADLLTVAFLAASMALAPRMAAFYSEKKGKKLQLMIVRAYRGVALITFPVVIIFVFYGGIFLRIFGPAYLAAWPALIILSLGQFLNVLFGPSGTMLSMAGYERVTAFGVALSVIVTIGANLLLIPAMGIKGAAFGTALGLVIWNVLLAILCYRYTGIWTPVLGHFLLGKRGQQV